MVNSRNRNQAWQPQDLAKLRGIALPAKMKCGRCNKYMMHAQYSENQKNNVRWQISKGVTNPKAPICNNCNVTHIDELQCIDCDKWKGLEEYAKSRRVPDEAQCYACTEKQVTHKPVKEDIYTDRNKAFRTPDTSNGIVPDYWTSSSVDGNSATDEDWQSAMGDRSSQAGGGVPLTSSFNSLSINGSCSGASLIDTEDAFPSPGNHVANSRATASWRTPSTGPGSTGRTVSSRTVVSDVGTERTYASTVAERSTAAGVGRRGWARIRADESDGPVGYGRASPVQPQGDAQREVEADTNPWDSDEESDEEPRGGGDYDSDDSDGDNTVI